MTVKRTDWRLSRNIAILCLPTLAVVALGVLFLVDKVPEIEKAEADRVKSVYREAALAIRQEPEKFQTTRRIDEWKPAGKMAPGKWGFSPIRLKRITWVWYDDGGEELRVTSVQYVPETDYRTMFWAFGILFLLVLVGVTAFGIRYFVGYVKSRDDFMSATAHDLTTPLVAMRRLIGRDDAEAKDLNERMIRLVENIKAFLRLGGKRPAPEPAAVDLGEVFRAAYALFREDYRDLFGGRDVGFEAEGTVIAFADETLVSQIVWNLLGNDLKYAAPFGPVRARIFTDGDRTVFELADEGKGMTRREMRKAFDRYYRAKTVLESGKGGFGIGLCNAREFARAMGGDLTVRANRPTGCVFTLTLPSVPKEQLSR